MEHHKTPLTERWWSGEHRAALHRYVVGTQAGGRAVGEKPASVLNLAKHAEPRGDVPMTPIYQIIRYVDGGIFYDGASVTLADAQVMLNDAILDGRVKVGSFLHVDSDQLIIQPPDADPGA